LRVTFFGAVVIRDFMPLLSPPRPFFPHADSFPRASLASFRAFPLDEGLSFSNPSLPDDKLSLRPLSFSRAIWVLPMIGIVVFLYEPGRRFSPLRQPHKYPPRSLSLSIDVFCDLRISFFLTPRQRRTFLTIRGLLHSLFVCLSSAGSLAMPHAVVPFAQ